MRKLLLVCLALLTGTLLHAQDSLIYGLNFANSQLRLARLNVFTGQLDIINSTPTSPDQFSSGVAAIDYIGGKYFYTRANQIYTVDLNTGNVLNSPSVTCPSCVSASYSRFTNIEYNPLSGELYGLRHYDDSLRLAKINPATGVVTEISPVATSQAIYQSGVSCLNPYLGVYYYQQGADRLVTVDLASGAVVSNVAIPNPNGALNPLTNIAYNYLDGHIYGLNYIGSTASSAAELRLAKYNPLSGQYAIITTNPVSADLFQHGVADVEPIGNIYTYTRNTGGVNDEAISLDLTTGQVVARPTVNGTGSIMPITNICYPYPIVTTITPENNFDLQVVGNTASFTSLSRYCASWQWDFGDGTTHTAEHPEHTYTSPGTYTVSLITQNEFGRDTLTQTVNVGLTALEGELENSLKLSPNPTTGNLNLELPASWNSLPTEVHWMDTQGKTLGIQRLAPGQTRLKVPEGGSGLLFATFQNGDQQLTRRVILLP